MFRKNFSHRTTKYDSKNFPLAPRIFGKFRLFLKEEYAEKAALWQLFLICDRNGFETFFLQEKQGMTKKKTWARIKSTNRPGVFLVFVSEEAKMAHHQQYEKLLNRNKGARANVRC